MVIAAIRFATSPKACRVNAVQLDRAAFRPELLDSLSLRFTSPLSLMQIRRAALVGFEPGTKANGKLASGSALSAISILLMAVGAGSLQGLQQLRCLLGLARR